MTLAARDCIKAFYRAFSGKSAGHAAHRDAIKKAFELTYALTNAELNKVVIATWGRKSDYGREGNMQRLLDFVTCGRAGLSTAKHDTKKVMRKPGKGALTGVWINECATIPESAIETIKNREPI